MLPMNRRSAIVCEGCLRSVELGRGRTRVRASLDVRTAVVRIDSRPSEIESERCRRRRVPRVAPDSRPTEAGETIDWVTTWTRGTLGSLGRFQLRERLGDGGFGQVFLAYDPRLDRDVAIKVLKQPNPSERVMERFFREARAVARLDHPNIVAVHDAGFDDGRCWVAYQFVERPAALVVSRPPADGRRRRRPGSSATWPTRSTTRITWASSIATSSRPTS